MCYRLFAYSLFCMLTGVSVSLCTLETCKSVVSNLANSQRKRHLAPLRAFKEIIWSIETLSDGIEDPQDAVAQKLIVNAFNVLERLRGGTQEEHDQLGHLAWARFSRCVIGPEGRGIFLQLIANGLVECFRHRIAILLRPGKHVHLMHDNFNNNVFHLASMSANQDMISALMGSFNHAHLKALLEQENRDGLVPVDVALKARHTGVAKYLKELYQLVSHENEIPAVLDAHTLHEESALREALKSDALQIKSKAAAASLHLSLPPKPQMSTKSVPVITKSVPVITKSVPAAKTALKSVHAPTPVAKSVPKSAPKSMPALMPPVKSIMASDVDYAYEKIRHNKNANGGKKNRGMNDDWYLGESESESDAEPPHHMKELEEAGEHMYDRFKKMAGNLK